MPKRAILKRGKALEGAIATALFHEVLLEPKATRLSFDDHFTVDGTFLDVSAHETDDVFTGV